jgi:preprotein translocase subunit Sec63
MDGENKGKIHKAVGAGIGLILGGPVGAALGLLVGHTIEKNPELLEKAFGDRNLRPHYDALEIPYSAGFEDVRRAYKKLARKYHPDKFVDADPVIQELAKAKMAEINEAYSEIADVKKTG